MTLTSSSTSAQSLKVIDLRKIVLEKRWITNKGLVYKPINKTFVISLKVKISISRLFDQFYFITVKKCNCGKNRGKYVFSVLTLYTRT